MKLRYLSTLALGFFLSPLANADTITFDDLSGQTYAHIYDPPTTPQNGYHGLNWYELFVFDTSGVPAGGFVNGTISPNNVLYIPDFTPPPLSPPPLFPPATITASTPFLLESGYFTAASLNGVTLEVVGRNGATIEFDQKFVIDATQTSFLTFPNLPVTELDFTPTGGDYRSNPTYIGGGDGIVFDNLTIDFVNVPEAASTAWLLAASAGGLALLRKRFS